MAHNSLDKRESSRNALRKLPSRRWQKRHHQASVEEDDSKGSEDQSSSHLLSRELEERRLYKLKVLRRFRWVKRAQWGNRRKNRSFVYESIVANLATGLDWSHISRFPVEPKLIYFELSWRPKLQADFEYGERPKQHTTQRRRAAIFG